MLRFMRNKILIPSLILLILAGFFSFRYIKGDNTSDERKELVLETISDAIDKVHFAPRELNDSFSARVYDKLLSTFDNDKKFFTKADIDELSKYKYTIDDQIKSGSVEFFDKLNDIYTKRISDADGFYEDILSKPFDFKKDEEILLGEDNTKYPADMNGMKERWRKYLKYRVLAKYVDLKDNQLQRVDDKDTSLKEVKTDAQLEEEARESIKKSQAYYFKRMKKFDEKDRFTVFINTITNSHDPHTDYLPPSDKKRFDEAMSGTFFGIGAQLRDDEGKVKIVAIIPGSPCWKQGELKAGDIIIKVGQGKEEAIDVEGMDLDEVVKKIRGPKGTEVRLTVKKVNGAIQVIPIIRGEVLLEEVFAKSAIINTDKGKIGYIYLPEFYSDFQHINGRRCAEDVAIEVLKLKKSGVAGMILDLRNNSGGSLSDVVDMAGLFIDHGPIVQVRSSGAPPATLQDRQKGALYDGPLAIMVNQGSASASEIMAAALQDYGRAIIVGTKTFGKGSVQKIISLDQFLSITDRLAERTQSKNLTDDKIGSLKITIQKFYRVNGGSTQLKGVTPDITFPDNYQLIDMGERNNDAALAWDEIDPADYTKVSNRVPVKKLADLSYARINASPIFKMINANAKRIKKQQDDDIYSLNEVAYRNELKAANNAVDKMKEIEKKNNKPLTVVNITEDLQKINIDSSSIAKNKSWLESLQKDVYISETVNIINDMGALMPNVTMKREKEMELE